MGEDAAIRIGDAERADARELLDEHLSAGRLTTALHEERCSLAAIAQTRGELAALFGDLPEPHPEFRSSAPAAVQTTTVAHPAPSRWYKHGETACVILTLTALFGGGPAAIWLTWSQGVWWSIIAVAFVFAVAVALGVEFEKRAGQ